MAATITSRCRSGSSPPFNAMVMCEAIAKDAQLEFRLWRLFYDALDCMLRTHFAAALTRERVIIEATKGKSPIGLIGSLTYSGRTTESDWDVVVALSTDAHVGSLMIDIARHLKRMPFFEDVQVLQGPSIGWTHL